MLVLINNAVFDISWLVHVHSPSPTAKEAKKACMNYVLRI